MAAKDSKEQELQQKLMFYQLLQQQLEELKKQATYLQSRFMDIETSRIALEDVGKIKENNELLISLGSGIYSHGKIQKTDLLVDVGAGVMVKKPQSEALALIEGKKKELEGLSMNLQQEMIATINKLQEIGMQLEAEVAAERK